MKLRLGLALALICTGVLANDAPIRALRWLAPGEGRLRALAFEPAECLRIPSDPARARSVEIGRAAFRSPLLLGGQAARAGLSCESCHSGGRANPAFLFPGVSGPPGTADVTSSLFSSHRGDGTDNPIAIPDLAGPREGLKTPPEALPQFIRGLVVEEFDGAEPPPAVLAGLVDYVRALAPDACPTQAARAITLASLMDDVRRALDAARTAPDVATAQAMIAGARARLGLIDERYAGLAAERRALRVFDRDLARAAAARRDSLPGADRRLARSLSGSRALEARLRRSEARSLFDFKTLQDAT